MNGPARDTASPCVTPGVEQEAERIRVALRKLDLLDEEGSRAFQALGYLLGTIRGMEKAHEREANRA